MKYCRFPVEWWRCSRSPRSSSRAARATAEATARTAPPARPAPPREHRHALGHRHEQDDRRAGLRGDADADAGRRRRDGRLGRERTYSAVLPIGVYSIAVAATNYATSTVSQSVLAAGNHVLNVALTPTGGVLVKILGLPTSSAPGTVMNLTAQVTILDGSTLTGYLWSRPTRSPRASSRRTPPRPRSRSGTPPPTRRSSSKCASAVPLGGARLRPADARGDGPRRPQAHRHDVERHLDRHRDINSTMPFAAWALGSTTCRSTCPAC